MGEVAQAFRFAPAPADAIENQAAGQAKGAKHRDSRSQYGGREAGHLPGIQPGLDERVSKPKRDREKDRGDDTEKLEGSDLLEQHEALPEDFDAIGYGGDVPVDVEKLR